MSSVSGGDDDGSSSCSRQHRGHIRRRMRDITYWNRESCAFVVSVTADATLSLVMFTTVAKNSSSTMNRRRRRQLKLALQKGESCCQCLFADKNKHKRSHMWRTAEAADGKHQMKSKIGNWKQKRRKIITTHSPPLIVKVANQRYRTNEKEKVFLFYLLNCKIYTFAVEVNFLFSFLFISDQTLQWFAKHCSCLP